MKITPQASVIINVVAIAAGIVLKYVGDQGLPAPWPPETSHVVQAQAAWIGGLGGAISAAVGNTVLHLLSSQDAGSLAK
jgi:hypothetical protein